MVFLVYMLSFFGQIKSSYIRVILGILVMLVIMIAMGLIAGVVNWESNEKLNKEDIYEEQLDEVRAAFIEGRHE